MQENMHIYRGDEDRYCGCGEGSWDGSNHYACAFCDEVKEDLELLRDPVTDDEVWICPICYDRREQEYRKSLKRAS